MHIEILCINASQYHPISTNHWLKCVSCLYAYSIITFVSLIVSWSYKTIIKILGIVLKLNFTVSPVVHSISPMIIHSLLVLEVGMGQQLDLLIPVGC